MECFLVSFVHWCTILWTPSEQRLLQFAICVSIVSIPARATPLRQRLSMGSLTGCATCARVGANKPHLLASKEALPALGRALSSDDAEVRLNAASAVWALVYDSQKAKAEVKKLAAQGIIILAPSVSMPQLSLWTPRLQPLLRRADLRHGQRLLCSRWRGCQKRVDLCRCVAIPLRGLLSLLHRVMLHTTFLYYSVRSITKRQAQAVGAERRPSKLASVSKLFPTQRVAAADPVQHSQVSALAHV